MNWSSLRLTQLKFKTSGKLPKISNHLIFYQIMEHALKMKYVGGAHEQFPNWTPMNTNFEFEFFSSRRPWSVVMLLRYLGGGFFRACLETSRKLHSNWQGIAEWYYIFLYCACSNIYSVRSSWEAMNLALRGVDTLYWQSCSSSHLFILLGSCFSPHWQLFVCEIFVCRPMSKFLSFTAHSDKLSASLCFRTPFWSIGTRKCQQRRYRKSFVLPSQEHAIKTSQKLWRVRAGPTASLAKEAKR